MSKMIANIIENILINQNMSKNYIRKNSFSIFRHFNNLLHKNQCANIEGVQGGTPWLDGILLLHNIIISFFVWSNTVLKAFLLQTKFLRISLCSRINFKNSAIAFIQFRNFAYPWLNFNKKLFLNIFLALFHTLTDKLLRKYLFPKVSPTVCAT